MHSPSSSARKGWQRVLGSPLLEALAAPHGVEGYLQSLNPMWSLDQVRARVTSVRRPTADAVTLRLRPNAHWRGFAAGQYVSVEVEVDGVRRRRCYSISAGEASSSTVEITVQRQSQGLVSGYLHERAHVGMVLGLSQAQGEFVLPPATDAPLILIAGGSGITPIASMLRTLAERGHRGEVHLLHYVRHAGQALLAAELQPLFDARAGHWQLHRHCTREGGAHFGAAHVAQLPVGEAQAYVCGPRSLIGAARAEWTARGLESRLRYEYFAPPSTGVATADAAGEIVFARSERGIASDGRSLLDLAERAGLRPASGCRMGVCHGCICRKRSGVVRDLRSGRLLGADVQTIQLCVTAAVGDVALDL